MLAKTANVPFYAVAENFKFVRCYPLSQYDLPTMCSALIHSGDMQRPQDSDNACSPVIGNSVDSDNHRVSLIDPNHPTIDYTPPTYITLLFTDVGVLTPSAVSDELIKMYC